MSPSGAEVLREIKSRIDEVDPGVVREQITNGAVWSTFARATSRRRLHPGRQARASLEPRVANRGRGPRSLAARDPLLRVGQPLGVGGAGRCSTTSATTTSSR